MNPMLLNVLLISGLVHVAAIVILGGITVVKYIIPDDAEFEEPPVIEEVEPPKEVKIEIKQQPKPDNQPRNNLKMKQVGNIAIADIDIDLPSMDDSFTVSAGIGSGGGGSGLLGGTRGSLGIGMSDVSVFGLKTRAERILFVIDVNRHMVTDAKGGLNSFKVIKDEITDMVGNLSAGTLFNVMLMDRRKGMLFKPQLVPAGAQIHEDLIKWIDPVNSNDNQIGLERLQNATQVEINVFPEHPFHEHLRSFGYAGNETGYQTQLALEQKIDAIFVITGYHKGFERIRRKLTEREEADWQRKISERKYIQQMEAHQIEKPQMAERIKQEMAKINKERTAKGQPKRILNSRHGVYSNARELDLEWETPHPGWRPNPDVPIEELEKYFKSVVKEIYTNREAQEPSVNVVLFLAGDEEYNKAAEKSLRDFVRFFSGKSRIIRGLNEIKSARSSGDTKN
ncbi:MAG: hypothetical protein ACSHYA_11510 [Opitutaceae bacterium]